MSVYRVPIEINFTDSGSAGVNTWHFRVTDEIVNPDEVKQSCVDMIHAFYVSLNQGLPDGDSCFAGNTVFSIGEARRLDEEEVATFDWENITAPAGVSDMPASQQLCVSWKTALPARRGQGRNFFGPLDAGIMGLDGRPTDDAWSLLGAAADTLVTTSEDLDGGALGIWGLETAGGSPSSPHVLRDLQGHHERRVFAVLRSRRD